jgi:tetratricopeptide (TPR) repeat protein
MLAHAALITAVSVGTVGLTGCSSGGDDPDTAQLPEPAVTADGHYAAGMFHEQAVIGKPGQDTSNQARKARDNAIDQYEKALELDPLHSKSLFRLAAIYTEQEDVDRAETYWTTYAEATDDAPEAWRNLAISMDLLGQSQKAEAAYRRCLAINANDADARVNLGMLLARAGRLPEARNELARILPPAEVHYHIARALQRAERHAEATKELRAAAAIDPRFSTIQATRID